MGNRKRSKIDRLPGSLKDAVEKMILCPAQFTYEDIVNYIQDNGFEISMTSVWRHAANLRASLETLHMAQENFRVIMEEMQRYPQLDTTEGIIRLLSHHVLEAVRHVDESEWKGLDPLKLMREATSLTRAAAYKSKIDLENKDTLEKGLEAVKTLAFETLAKDDPELYTRFTEFIDGRLGEPS